MIRKLMFHTLRPTHVPTALAAALLLFAASIAPAQTFVHPGALSTQADFTRMSNNVAAGAHPWIDDYNKMIASPVASLGWPFNPVTQISRGIAGQNNYVHSQEDAQNIYFLALRWRITGDTNYANRAIVGMDAWSSTMTNGVGGNSNFALAAGLCGYEFACAGEELRGYSGWSQASMNAYSNFLMIFYGSCNYFLTQHNGTCGSHYRCNWDACNMAAIIAIGVFCDNTNIFNQAIAYYTNGVGNGNIERVVDFIHPDGLGQEEESGRDQAHTMDGINSLSTFCQVAWNQGVDMYGYDNNRYLRALEYVAKCNIHGNSWIPYVHHTVCDMTYDEDTMWGAPIGAAEYFWETPLAHYANIKGISAPFTGAAAASSRPDGGIYNWNSPDWFGYSTLTSYLGPPTNSAPSPGGLAATVRGWQITLNWWGTSLATSYNVKRATSHGGPYTTIAVTSPNYLSYVDVGLTSGTTYYYVVSASQPGGETANSAELVASPNDVISGTVIGSDGSYGNTRRTIVNVFDGSFENFYDAVNGTGDWAGIDPGLGVSSVGSVITRIEYAPRKGYATRMVGGQFQGALAGDPNFTSPVTLYTIPTAPTDGFITAQNGVLTSATINNGTAFRYLRYIGPAGGTCDVSEVVFHGTATGLTAPAAPVNVAASVPWYGGEADLSWTASAGATSYTIKRATNSGGPYMVLENVSGFKELTAINSITNYTDYSVTAGGAYYYVITALNSAGETNSSQISVGTPVAGLTAAAGNHQVALSWTAAPGATSYNVKRGTVSGGPYTTLDSPATTNYTDTTAINGATYIYVVSANQPGGQSANSGEVIATPTTIVVSNYGFEAPVTSTYNYNPSGGSWTFSGTSPSGSGVSANSSAFTSGNSPAPEGVQVAFLQEFGSISQTISGFSPGTAYTITFAASQRNNIGQTFNVQIDGVTIGSFEPPPGVYTYQDYSTNFTASATNHTLAFVGTDLNGGDNTVFLDNVRIALLPLPPAPMGLAATAVSTDQINLSWPASSGATSYNVKRATVSGGPYTTVATGVTATTYYDAGLSGSTIYYYVVSAVNTYGESGNSTQASATTLGGAPTGLTATAGNNQVALSWTASSGATSYNVKRATVSGGPYTTIASPATNNYTDTTAASGTTYYYVVSTVNDSGESDDSPQVSVTTPLIWSGAVNGNWDTTTLNWVTGAAATYQDGVPVQFDDTALSNTTVSVVATVTPASVVFYNSVNNYTISGSGIAGACSLALFGNGAVTLSGANTFTNTTTINAGTLTLANSLALQNSTLNYSGGSLSFGSLTAATLGGLSGTVNLSLVNGSSTAVTLTAGGNGFSTSYSGNLSGSGSLIKNGASTLTLSGNNSYTGASTINAGTLALSGDNSFTGGISIGSTATLQLQAGSGNTTAGVSRVMPTQNMSRAQFPSGATIQLRADSSIASGGVVAFDSGATTFATDTSGNRLTGTLNFDVNQVTSGSSATTLQFGSTSCRLGCWDWHDDV